MLGLDMKMQNLENRDNTALSNYNFKPTQAFLEYKSCTCPTVLSNAYTHKQEIQKMLAKHKHNLLISYTKGP